MKKTIIVGNVSKYIPNDQRETSDKSTHKWMVYVRGDKDNPRIDNFVRKVWYTSNSTIVGADRLTGWMGSVLII